MYDVNYITPMGALIIISAALVLARILKAIADKEE